MKNVEFSRTFQTIQDRYDVILKLSDKIVSKKLVSYNDDPIRIAYKVYVPGTVFILSFDKMFWFLCLWLAPKKDIFVENRSENGKLEGTQNHWM